MNYLVYLDAGEQEFAFGVASPEAAWGAAYEVFPPEVVHDLHAHMTVDTQGNIEATMPRDKGGVYALACQPITLKKKRSAHAPTAHSG